MFGGVFNKKEKAEYEAAVKQMELQQMQHQMEMQQQIEMQKMKMQYQGLTSVSSGSTGSTILRNMQDDIRELRVNIEHISGFYRWAIHAYPETLVQYKALKDLEAASRGQDESEQYRTKSAV